MSRILTGIQSTGRPHLGNLLGAILPAIKLSAEEKNESFFFIADLHSLTSVKEGTSRQDNIDAVAATWLACGFDIEKNYFYRQSYVPEVCELTWYLNCFMSYNRLKLAHSFKDKSEKLGEEFITAGLFDYPVLMAADILLYDANIVPVGKDQKQHLEITRNLAQSINSHYGEELFVIPEARIDEQLMTIPGTDGQKMSKSYGNTIDVFLPEKKLKKQVMSIETNSTPLESPKSTDDCIVFKLYSLLATQGQIDTMKGNYEAGGYGYGHAKKELLSLILDKFAEERVQFDAYMSDPKKLNDALIKGEKKAKDVAQKTLLKFRKVLGFSK